MNGPHGLLPDEAEKKQKGGRGGGRGPAHGRLRAAPAAGAGDRAQKFSPGAQACVRKITDGIKTLHRLGPLGWTGGVSMSDTTNTHGHLIGIGLKDPFVRQIAAVVALASVGSFVISALGDGLKAVLTLALLLRGVREAVGIRLGAISGNMKISF
jgi:hypothetical protein